LGAGVSAIVQSACKLSVSEQTTAVQRKQIRRLIGVLILG